MKRLIIIILFFTNYLLTASGQSNNKLIEYYSKGELNKALEISTKLISKGDENGVYFQIHGRILADQGKYADAIPFLLKSIKKDGNKTDISGWAHGYLGQCYLLLGQYENSKRSLNNCIRLNATKNSIKYANKRLFLFGFNNYFSSWEMIETEHFRFHIQDPEKIDNIDVFVQLREKAFNEITSSLNCRLIKKIDFFVWDNKMEPKKKFKMNLGFASPLTLCVYSHKRQTVGHEMTHVISNYIGKSPKKTGLINEGLAVYFNMENDDKIETLKMTIKNSKYDPIKVIDFWNDWRNYPDRLSYPLAGAFIQKLIDSYGIERLKPLLINQTYKKAKELFGNGLDELIKEFEYEVNNGA